MGRINWKKRSAKIIASFITGYSGGLALIFPLGTASHVEITIVNFLIYPAISGFVVMLPQASKVLIEYANA